VPNVKSAAKRVRKSKKQNERNRAVRSVLRSAIRRVNDTIAEGDKEQLLPTATKAASVISKTANKGVIHRNKAARLQSRLRLRVNKALAETKSE
jgi:small subunit ribosomal protein S20